MAISPTQIMVLRNPMRRRIGRAAPRIASEPAADAKVIMPLAAADRPKPSCSIIGSRNGMAPTATRDRAPA